MKKLRIQPSFASLTEDEIEQLACMIQRETFAVVLERARKPRSEGGFGLTLRSESPLERLLDKKNKLDLINAQITDGKKLTLADLNTFTAGEHRAPEEVHDAIMSATYILVTEHDNTPHQLLALQRLADFPARVELREQSAQIRAQSAQDLSRLRNQSLAHRTERMQITRAKEQRAQAKEKRAAELHTHKIQMDHIRVFLKSNNRGGSLNGGTSSESPQPFSDYDINSHDVQVGPVSPSGPSSSSTQHSDLNTHHSLNHTAPQITDLLNTEHSPSADPNPVETKNSKLKIQNSNTAAASFLSPAVLANTRLYDQKVACGEIRHIFTPGKHYEIEYCNPADKPALERTNKSAPLRFIEDPTRTHYLPALRTFGPNPYIPPQTQHSELSTRARSAQDLTRTGVNLENTFGKNPYIPPSISTGGTRSPSPTSFPESTQHSENTFGKNPDQTASVDPSTQNPANPVHPVQNSNSTLSTQHSELTDPHSPPG